MSTATLPTATVDRFKCPLVVGVTGHRDLRPEELPAIEAAFEAVLADIVTRHPHSPLVLMTGLADGADQLAARLAVRRGIDFLALLPRPLPDYLDDFPAGESRARFEGLLARARGRLELAPPPDDAVAGRAGGRDARYATLGTFLAERSHFLIAIWDGVDNGKPGGTASVVAARTMPTVLSESLAWRELVPSDVVHILAGRGSTGPAAEPGRTTRRRPSDTQAARMPRHEDDDVPARIDDFNRDVDRLGARLADGFAESGRWLQPDPLPPPRAGTAALLRDHFAAFDRLAIHWQAAAGGAFLRLHCLIWLAVFCFELFTNFSAWFGAGSAAPLAGWMRQGVVGLYLALTVAAWAIATRSNRLKQQPKHLDYRSIAEAVRIQFFWRLAGLDRHAATLFLASQLSVLGWMRSAVATVSLVADARNPTERAAAPPRTLRLVNRGLCLGQLRYFRRAAIRDDRLQRRRGRTCIGLFAAGLTTTLALAVTGFRHPLLESVAAMLFVTAGLVASHTETLALDEHINQYSGMAQLYAAARRAVLVALRAGTPDRARRVLADVGEEALGENAAWVLLHRNRPLRVPQA